MTNIGMPSEISVKREGVFHLAITKLFDRRIVGRAFDAAVPTAIVVGAVSILFAVGLVVFIVVGDHIVERETIVAGDEVQALLGLALLMAIDFMAADEPIGRCGRAIRARRGGNRGCRRGTGRSIPSTNRRRTQPT